jgi:hypothetical protein
MCDNISAISVAKNLVFHKKMRHVERRHHFLRDHVEKGDIEMRYIVTERLAGGNWCLPSIWLGLRGDLVLLPGILCILLFSCIFLIFT